MKKQTERIVPKFATEAEEAEWWFKHREVHGKELLAAVRSGEAKTLTKAKLLERIEASKAKEPAQVISLRVPASDLAMARRQAGQKGLPYQTYIKSLLHETLAERSKDRIGYAAGGGAEASCRFSRGSDSRPRTGFPANRPSFC